MRKLTDNRLSRVAKELESRFNGNLGKAHNTEEREREREQITKNYIQNTINYVYFVHRMCLESTFIQVLKGMKEVLTRTSMLINELLH